MDLNIYTELAARVREEKKEERSDLILIRSYFDEGTHGVLSLPDGTELATLENPWKDNQRRVSCIPEGDYVLRMRESPVVQRTTRGRYTNGWEVVEVPGRDFIMVHPGNYVRNTDGCILPGMTHDFQGSTPVVWTSQRAMDIFMGALTGQREWSISIHN